MTKHRPKIARLLLAYVIGWIALTPAHSEPAAESVTPLMRQMAGKWSVEPKMWPGADAKAIELPKATAQRRIVSDAFLQEEMTPAGGSQQEAFTRIAYVSFNTINQQYEYFSLDSRLPQMMSYTLPGANQARDGQIELRGTSFVAPSWGDAKNVPFMYRLTISAVESGRQVVRLFLKEQRPQAKEFLAFEYLYIRQP
ncbi:DUF1579 family protein [Peristeroidobacter agariperforans]|uniref:DUF1579 family protein n=1 Tax=Peristeroidobacter agariperforans TaxID=268404 RepID=UPI00101C1F1C|nr:DUF1579 family protein [Peristeroidobacter agariperforans]